MAFDHSKNVISIEVSSIYDAASLDGWRILESPFCRGTDCFHWETDFPQVPQNHSTRTKYDLDCPPLFCSVFLFLAGANLVKGRQQICLRVLLLLGGKNLPDDLWCYIYLCPLVRKSLGDQSWTICRLLLGKGGMWFGRRYSWNQAVPTTYPHLNNHRHKCWLPRSYLCHFEGRGSCSWAPRLTLN